MLVLRSPIALWTILQCCPRRPGLHRCPCVQKKGGELGVGLTAAEFQVLAGKLLAEARDRSAGQPDCFPTGRIIVSLDNDKTHKKFQPADRLNVIPSRSPDIHKVVEHPLKAFKGRFYPAFSKDLSCTTCEDAMVLASDCLHQNRTRPIASGGICRLCPTRCAPLFAIRATGQTTTCAEVAGQWRRRRPCCTFTFACP